MHHRAQTVLTQGQWVPSPSPRRPRQALRFYGEHKQEVESTDATRVHTAYIIFNTNFRITTIKRKKTLSVEAH